MSVFTPVGKAAYQEAVRVVPGLLAAKERHAPDDAVILLDGYMQTIRELGLSPTEGWAALFNAAMHWCHQLVGSHANTTQVPPEQLLGSMAMLAAAWSCDAS